MWGSAKRFKLTCCVRRKAVENGVEKQFKIYVLKN